MLVLLLCFYATMERLLHGTFPEEPYTPIIEYNNQQNCKNKLTVQSVNGSTDYVNWGTFPVDFVGNVYSNPTKNDVVSETRNPAVCVMSLVLYTRNNSGVKLSFFAVGSLQHPCAVII